MVMAAMGAPRTAAPPMWGWLLAPPFVARKLKSQAERYSRPRLISCLRAIHETDLALKGAAGLKPEMALERLVLGLSG